MTSTRKGEGSLKICHVFADFIVSLLFIFADVKVGGRVAKLAIFVGRYNA